MKKPRIFISSTIFDFADLRSALKFYLEVYGFEVLLSEYNDFEKDLNLNSFEACLNTIENCSHFILFIGSRVGGYFNKKEEISITKAEYLKAYALAKEKEIKIIVFIRDQIWTVREDRKGLEEMIASSNHMNSDKE